jgi:hypothetical protein
MWFPSRLFQVAGTIGLLAVLPLFFLERWVGRVVPPAINHLEQFYGLLGVTASWQVAFLVIARDPVRYRPLMIPAILEKASFGIATIALFLVGRIPSLVLMVGLIDLALGVLFALAYRQTAPRA